MGGIRKGSKHNWNYHTKYAKEFGNGYFIQGQSKGRNIRAPIGSGMPTKSNLIWGIKGQFKVKKIGQNKYLRITWGDKYQKAFRLPKRRWVVSKAKSRKRRRARYYGKR